MITKVATFLASLFGGKIGAAVSDIAILGAVLSAIGAALMWIVSDKGNAIFVSITYRDAFFWFGILAVIVLIVKYSPSPRKPKDFE